VVVRVTGIERRLLAACLALVKYNFATRAPQNLNRAQADTRTKLINQTGNKKSNSHEI
jgi:hypothetical protein